MAKISGKIFGNTLQYSGVSARCILTLPSDDSLRRFSEENCRAIKFWATSNSIHNVRFRNTSAELQISIHNLDILHHIRLTIPGLFIQVMFDLG